MHEVTGENLDQFRIKNAPSSMYYVANFISEEEEEDILDKVSHL